MQSVHHFAQQKLDPLTRLILPSKAEHLLCISDRPAPFLMSPHFLICPFMFRTRCFTCCLRNIELTCAFRQSHLTRFEGGFCIRPLLVCTRHCLGCHLFGVSGKFHGIFSCCFPF